MLKKIILFYLSALLPLDAAELIISSYNCGGLSHHFDYLRAATMHKLMSERRQLEPEAMELNARVQELALGLLFSKDEEEIAALQQSWNDEQCYERFMELVRHPKQPGSPSHAWYCKSQEMITPYDVRPVLLFDKEVQAAVCYQMEDLGLNGRQEDWEEALARLRRSLFEKTVREHLLCDLLCFQEANYLDSSLFPEEYELHISHTTPHSKKAIAWKKERFTRLPIVQSYNAMELGNFDNRSLILLLLDNETQKKLLVISCHLPGCEPYGYEPIGYDHWLNDQWRDFMRGNNHLFNLLHQMQWIEADLVLLGLDANVAATHPRLRQLKDYQFHIDYHTPFAATCTNPNYMLDTRIDWIALQTRQGISATIEEIPLPAIQLNDIANNMSDHRPIKAKVTFTP